MEGAGLRQLVGMSPMISSALSPEAVFSPGFAHKVILSKKSYRFSLGDPFQALEEVI